jgi:hypothetical protein
VYTIIQTAQGALLFAVSALVESISLTRAGSGLRPIHCQVLRLAAGHDGPRRTTSIEAAVSRKTLESVVGWL